MSRSVGEAISTGLESGFRLGLDVQQQRRNNERQDRLDQQAQGTLDYNRGRQTDADARSALDAQEAELTKEGTAMASSSVAPAPEVQADFARRANAVRAAKSTALAKRSGVDVHAVQQAARVDLQQINSAADAAQLQPGQLTRAVTVATNRPVTDYLRNGDQPSPVEQAGKDFVEGIQSGDTKRALAGVNIMYAPQLRAGIGSPSPQGGTIVGKQIINLVPDPNAPEGDPRVIPMLRVYVNKDPNFRGPTEPGAPDGATGHYDAPLTQNRSGDPNDPVKSIGLKEGMDYVGHNLHLAELLNDPQARAKLQEDQQAGNFDPKQYLSALQMLGVKAAKNTTKNTVIPAGGSILQETVGPDGNVVSTKVTKGESKIDTSDKLTIFGNGIDKQVEQGVMSEEEGAQLKADFARRQANGSGDAALQTKLREIDDDTTLTDAQRAEQRKAVLSGIKPPKPGGLGAAGSSARDDDRRIGRQIQTLKDTRLELQDKRKQALDEFKLASKDASKKEQATAKAAYDVKIRGFDADESDLKGRLKKLNDRLDAADTPDDSASTGLGAAKPAGGSSDTKVSPGDQKVRDTERVRILNSELQTTQTKLTTQKSSGAAADTIERTQSDIAALQREIASATKSAPGGGLGAARKPAPSGTVLKFDKNGQRVTN